MTKRLVLYLVRKKLGLRKGEGFRFTNQISKDDVYFFGVKAIYKRYFTPYWGWQTKRSSVSLNWLLDDECEIERVGEVYVYD